MSVLDPAGVAGLLKIPEARFRRKWRRMVRDDGFPSPLPGVGLRWSAFQVEAWVVGNGAPPPAETARTPSMVDQARDRLAARYAA